LHWIEFAASRRADEVVGIRVERLKAGIEIITMDGRQVDDARNSERRFDLFQWNFGAEEKVLAAATYRSHRLQRIGILLQLICRLLQKIGTRSDRLRLRLTHDVDVFLFCDWILVARGSQIRLHFCCWGSRSRWWRNRCRSGSPRRSENLPANRSRKL